VRGGGAQQGMVEECDTPETDRREQTGHTTHTYTPEASSRLDYPRTRACLTAMHTFVLTRLDGTTVAERCCGRQPRSMVPALLEAVAISPAPLRPPRRAVEESGEPKVANAVIETYETSVSIMRHAVGLAHGVGDPSSFWARHKPLSTEGPRRVRTPASRGVARRGRHGDRSRVCWENKGAAQVLRRLQECPAPPVPLPPTHHTPRPRWQG
jgi:hypothetical protein